MELTFFIDRQFGHAILINVADGIVTGVVGNSTIERKIESEYIGKSISFLKNNFEEGMLPNYHCVKCAEWCNLLDNINITKNNIKNCETIMTDPRTTEEIIVKLNETILRFEIEIIEFDAKKLEIEKYLDSINFPYPKNTIQS